MTLERQAEVALDSAALLDGFGGASEADPVGRIGMTCDQASISTRARTGESTDKVDDLYEFQKTKSNSNERGRLNRGGRRAGRVVQSAA
jgi:hypothetical protein